MARERADRGAGTGFAPGVGDLGAEESSESRFDKSPCPHVLRFFLAPNELRAFWKRLEHFAQPFLGEWIKLLDANERCIVDFAFTAIFQQIVIVFAGAEDDALHVVGRWNAFSERVDRLRRSRSTFTENFFEPALGEFFNWRRCILRAQETLWRSDDKRLDEIAFHLATQDVKILCSGRDIADLNVVFGTFLQKALDASTRVFRPLAFISMRE